MPINPLERAITDVLISQAPDFVGIYDETQNWFTQVNPAGLQLLGYNSEEEFLTEANRMLRNPEVSRQFVRLLAGRVREQEELLLDMAYNSLRKRVADTLLRLHEQQRTLDPADPQIQLSRDDMAALIGTAPESLSRTLSEFRQDGIIELTNKFIRVQQPEKLRRTNW